MATYRHEGASLLLPQFPHIHKHVGHVLLWQLSLHAQRFVQHLDSRGPFALGLGSVEVGVVQEIHEYQICVETVQFSQEIEVDKAVGVLVEAL